MRRRWRQYRSLSPMERRLFWQAQALLALCRLAIACIGLRRWQALLLRSSGEAASPAPVERLALARQVAQTVERAAAHSPFRPNCLPRSLTLWRLLRQRGIESSLCIGARREGEALQAHAWVECEGVVLNDRPDVRTVHAVFDTVA